MAHRFRARARTLAVVPAGQGAATLVIGDALGNPLIQPLALLWVKLQPTNQRVGRVPHLAHGPLPIVFS